MYWERQSLIKVYSFKLNEYLYRKKKNDRFASVCLPLLWAQENVGRVWHPGFWESHPSWFWTLTMVYSSRPHAAPWWSKGVTVAAEKVSIYYYLGPPPVDWASLVAQRLKRLPPMRETWAWSLGSGRSPGEGNGNRLQHSCLENPMDGGACRLQSTGSQRVGHDWATSLSACWSPHVYFTNQSLRVGLCRTGSHEDEESQALNTKELNTTTLTFQTKVSKNVWICVLKHLVPAKVVLLQLWVQRPRVVANPMHVWWHAGDLSASEQCCDLGSGGHLELDLHLHRGA